MTCDITRALLIYSQNKLMNFNSQTGILWSMVLHSYRFGRGAHHTCKNSLTRRAEERSWTAALLVIPQPVISQMLCHTLSWSIRLSRGPVPEGRRIVIGPGERVLEQADVCDLSRRNELLDLKVLVPVPHAGQICVKLSAVSLSFSPRLLLLNVDVFVCIIILT